MFNSCTQDTRGRGGGASEDGLLCLSHVDWMQGGGEEVHQKMDCYV